MAVLACILGREVLATFYSYHWDMALASHSEGAVIREDSGAEPEGRFAWDREARAIGSGPHGWISSTAVANTYEEVWLEWAAE